MAPGPTPIGRPTESVDIAFVWGDGTRPEATSVTVCWHCTQMGDGSICLVEGYGPGVFIDVSDDKDGVLRVTDCLSLSFEGARHLAAALLATIDKAPGTDSEL